MFFFAKGGWEFAPSEVVEGLRIPLETSIPLVDVMKYAPQLSEEEVDWINTILAYARKNETAMFYRPLVTTANIIRYLGHPQRGDLKALLI